MQGAQPYPDKFLPCELRVRLGRSVLHELVPNFPACIRLYAGIVQTHGATSSVFRAGRALLVPLRSALDSFPPRVASAWFSLGVRRRVPQILQAKSVLNFRVMLCSLLQFHSSAMPWAFFDHSDLSRSTRLCRPGWISKTEFPSKNKTRRSDPLVIFDGVFRFDVWSRHYCHTGKGSSKYHQVHKKFNVRSQIPSEKQCTDRKVIVKMIAMAVVTRRNSAPDIKPSRERYNFKFPQARHLAHSSRFALYPNPSKHPRSRV